MDDHCGVKVNGIVMCLSYSTDTSRFVIELRNVGSADTVLNIGTMLGNGAQQFPTAMKLLSIMQVLLGRTLTSHHTNCARNEYAGTA